MKNTTSNFSFSNYELKKDKECLQCEKFFDCKGKPKEVKECLQFEERKKRGE